MGDSWTQFPVALGGETEPLRPDGVTLGDGMQFLSEHLKDYALTNGQTLTTINQGKGGMTSEYGRYWIKDQIINWSTKPDYCVIVFSINDYNSRTNYPSTPSAYDFDSDKPFAFDKSDVIGACDLDRWLVNMQYMSRELLKNNIKPIIIMPCLLFSAPTTSALSEWANYMVTNFNND